MAELKLEIQDGVIPNDKLGDQEPVNELVDCTVIAEDGILKQGKLWPKGSVLKLSPAAAARFKEVREVEYAK